MVAHTSNQLSGAEAIVRLLDAYQVRHIFGLCGDTSLPLYDALFRLDHSIEHILTRDERHAAYMADAYARVTRKPGVCEGPSGGGATYILPGLIEASESSIPILAMTTDVATTSAGQFPLTELDQKSLFRPLTKWNDVIPSASAVPKSIRQAFREMTTGRPGAVHLGLPFDVQKNPVPGDDLRAEAGLAHYPSRPSAGSASDIEAIARLLMAAKRPLIMCGGGVVIAGAEAALQRVCEKLPALVATTISGQGSISETHPLAVGVVGSNGGIAATRAIVDEADVILMIGCRAGSVTTERWRHPAPDQATILHIDADPAVIGVSYQTEAAAVADARLALEALDLAIDRKPGDPAPLHIRAAEVWAAKWAAFEPLARSDARPITPERTIKALQNTLPQDGIIVADPGTPCPYVSAYYRFSSQGRHFISNRAHGALGYALGASIGAQIGRPTAPVVSMMGDGSFAMAVGELETVKRLNLPITFIVFANDVFGWIKAGQKSGFDSRYFSVDFTRNQHAKIAQAFGIDAVCIEDPAELEPALKAAINSDRPNLIEIVSQPLQDANAPVSEWVA